jgi:hypothetical protein
MDPTDKISDVYLWMKVEPGSEMLHFFNKMGRWKMFNLNTKSLQGMKKKIESKICTTFLNIINFDYL